MIRETAEELLAHCREIAGEDLRVVTRYSEDEHDPLYTRDHLHENTDINEETRPRFRYRLMQIHRSIWEMSLHHSLIDDPEIVTHSYGDVTFVQFPVAKDEGVIVTFDGEHPTSELICRCKQIVYQE